MAKTKEDIVKLLNELDEVYTDLRQAVQEDWPYSKVKALYEKQDALKADIKQAVECVTLAPEEKERVFESDSGQVASKLTVKQPLMADVFIEDMVTNHRDEFLARASTWCDIVKKGVTQNPIKGVSLTDPKYLGSKKFEVTTTNTYKMGTVLMKSMEWAFDVNNIQVVPEGRTALERMESMYDGICRLLS